MKLYSIYYSEKRDKVCLVSKSTNTEMFIVEAIRTETKELDFEFMSQAMLKGQLLAKEYVLIGYV